MVGAAPRQASLGSCGARLRRAALSWRAATAACAAHGTPHTPLRIALPRAPPQLRRTPVAAAQITRRVNLLGKRPGATGLLATPETARTRTGWIHCRH